jgi:hypothetical protein
MDRTSAAAKGKQIRKAITSKYNTPLVHLPNFFRFNSNRFYYTTSFPFVRQQIHDNIEEHFPQCTDDFIDFAILRFPVGATQKRPTKGTAPRLVHQVSILKNKRGAVSTFRRFGFGFR